jgi:hypothetical protein
MELWDVPLGDRPSTPAPDHPGFSSFLEPFFFSFHKEEKKVTERFDSFRTFI